jgi:serine/threonine-protein kinase
MFRSLGNNIRLMTPERWQRIDELFRTVVEQPLGARDAYLTQVCGGDDELRQELLSLLESDTAEDFFAAPIKDAALSLNGTPKEEFVSERIGAYQLTRLIGHGGMGAVYEAVRADDQFQQKVAIKLIKRGMDSDFVRERFLRERQILASLDHPFIARLLDGGTTAAGLPYFVMEFVTGQPLTMYRHTHALTIPQRLELFRQVCAAVQHAHQKLVIHRDLKPSNILVTAEGTPKLLDFGIAKLLAPGPGEALTRTESAVRLMTPDYASPEQVRGLPIATTSDVYALGVLLYELLTGRRPYEFKTLSPAEIERAICDTATEEPSKAVARMTGAPPKLAKQLAGDLDNIVMMALRKEPERRYQSVEQFSEDIRRHLTGLPIRARADTFRYRTGKFVQRHKAGVAALAALFALTLALAVLAVRLTRERNRANQSAATTQEVMQSLVSVFEFADPGTAKGNPILANELLDRSAEKAVRELQDQPVQQAQLMDTIGGLYLNLGRYDRAQTLLADALRLRRQTLGAQHADVAESLQHLGDLLYEKGDFVQSETLLREALALRRWLLGDEHLKTADSMASLGRALIALGKFTEAEPVVKGALALRRQQLPPKHKDIAASLMHGWARLLHEQGKFAEATESYRESLAIHRALYGEQHPATAASMNNLATTLREWDQLPEAETLAREALDIRLKLHGEEHPDVTGNMGSLAALLQEKGDYAEAEQLFRRTLAVRRKLFGENNVRLASTMSSLATVLDARGQYQESETMQRQALAMKRKDLGEDHRLVGVSLHYLADLFGHQRRYAEAEKLQQQAIAVYQKSLPPEHWMILRSRSHLGECLIQLKRYAEAEEQLLIAHANLKAARLTDARQTISRLVKLYQAWGKPAQAAPYRALIRNGER